MKWLVGRVMKRTVEGFEPKHWITHLRQQVGRGGGVRDKKRKKEQRDGARQDRVVLV